MAFGTESRASRHQHDLPSVAFILLASASRGGRNSTLDRYSTSPINGQATLAPLHNVTRLTPSCASIIYFNPITVDSAPTSGSTRVFENPASRIQV